jgi:hypothetical protein
MRTRLQLDVHTVVLNAGSGAKPYMQCPTPLPATPPTAQVEMQQSQSSAHADAVKVPPLHVASADAVLTN